MLRAAALAVGVLASAPAAALEAEARLGIDGRVGGSWTPLEVVLRAAPGEPPLRGRVSVTLRGLAPCVAPFALEPGASARVQLEVPVLPGQAYTVRIEHAGGALLRTVEPASWEAVTDDERWIVIADPDALAIASAIPGRRCLARPSPERLRGYGARVLRGVTALVLPLDDRDPGLHELVRDPAALAAIGQFVRAGGRLLLLPRAGAPPPPAELLGPLLPLAALAPTAVPRAELDALLERAEGDVAASELPALEGRLAPGARWLHHTGRHGVLAERRLGAGASLLLTVDPDLPALRGAPRLGAFIGSALGERAEGPAPGLDHLAPGLEALGQEVLEARAPAGPLAVGAVALVLLLHLLLLGPVAARWSRRRGPWGGLLLPAGASLALAAAVFATGALLRAGRRGEVRALELAVQRGEGPVVAQVELGVLADASGPVELELDPGWVPLLRRRGLQQALHFRAPPAALSFLDGRAARFGPLPLSAGEAARVGFVADDAPRLPAALTREGPAWRLRCETPLLGAVGVRLGDAGARWSPLALDPDRRGARWLEQDGRPVPPLPDGVAPPLTLDPFRDEDAARRELLVAAASSLADAHAHLPGAVRLGAPTAFVLALSDATALPAEVRPITEDDPREPLPARGLRITVLPLEGP